MITPQKTLHATKLGAYGSCIWSCHVQYLGMAVKLCISRGKRDRSSHAHRHGWGVLLKRAENITIKNGSAINQTSIEKRNIETISAIGLLCSNCGLQCPDHICTETF